MAAENAERIVPRRRRDVVELDTDTGFTHDDRFDYVSIHRALI